MTVLFAILLSLASYFAWTYIHEMAHLLMAKKLVGVTKYEMKLYPHRYNGELRWGSVKYWMKRQSTDDEDYFISIAPRLPNMLACALFPLAAFMNGWFALVWMIFWGAGIVDLMYGSIGWSEYSDLIQAAVSKKINPWRLRLLGFGAAALSIATYCVMELTMMQLAVVPKILGG